ncbi:MAG: ferritin-like domain-containing protein [Trebonia sp.]
MAASGAKIAALQGALTAEHAAVYGYGVVGAMLGGAEQADARADWTAHQVARDTLTAMVTRLGATPEAASPAYQLPFAVTGAKSAERLAATLEHGVTRAYLGLVAVSDPTLRSFAAQAMQASANRAVAWSGTTVAFPGMPARPALTPAQHAALR